MAMMMKTSHCNLHDRISEMSERADVWAGSALPLGTQETEGGVNFAIFSRVSVRVMRTDEELMIAKTVCRVLGVGMVNEKGKSDHAT